MYGDGKTLPTDPVLQSEGLTFAVGFHVSAVLMGYKPSGLYLEASGGFDALLAPDPMYLGGIFEIGGELRLFIISISAWAKLVVIYRDPGARLYVHGEAHGKVDFFFFSVEGSVELTIGSPPANDPGEPPPLVSGVSLIARSTQVTIEGSGSSGPVDGSLGKAATGRRGRRAGGADRRGAAGRVRGGPQGRQPPRSSAACSDRGPRSRTTRGSRWAGTGGATTSPRCA